jgi:hypothetical protein
MMFPRPLRARNWQMVEPIRTDLANYAAKVTGIEASPNAGHFATPLLTVV